MLIDDFNRANGGLGPDWTTDPFAIGSTGMQVAGGKLAGNNAGGLSEAYWNAGQFSATRSMRARVKIKARASSLGDAQVEAGFLRQIGPTCDGYMAVLTFDSPDQVDVYRVDDGSLVGFSTASLASQVAINDTFALYVMPSGTIAVTINNKVVKSVFSSTYFHSGQSAYSFLGISDQGGSLSVVRLDDFNVATGVILPTRSFPDTIEPTDASIVPYSSGAVAVGLDTFVSVVERSTYASISPLSADSIGA